MNSVDNNVIYFTKFNLGLKNFCFYGAFKEGWTNFMVRTWRLLRKRVLQVWHDLKFMTGASPLIGRLRIDGIRTIKWVQFCVEFYSAKITEFY